MNDFSSVRNHERFLQPQNAGDIMVQEKLSKYENELEKLISNKRYDIDKIAVLENNHLKDDFEFWWYKIDRSYINNLIKTMKSQAKIKS